jgi:hypothetical protein
MKKAPDDRLAVVKGIEGIDNDGGDPGDNEVDQHPKVVWA